MNERNRTNLAGDFRFLIFDFRLPIENRKLKIKNAFTLLGLMTTIAALIILLGLMVGLARDVRSRSADALTLDLLGQLEHIMAPYRNHAALQAALAKIEPVVSAKAAENAEDDLRRRAEKNSQDFVRTCREILGPDVFGELPLSLYDQSMLRDAWGMPVAYMPPGAPNIQIAAQSFGFFWSAGPDRKFKTLADNLYSYERPVLDNTNNASEQQP
jgi:hypothetical protein